MENTKLIKKLKSIGFVPGEYWPKMHLELQIEEYKGFVRYAFNTNALLFFIDNVFTGIRVEKPTFDQIINKIKEVTGVTISPKPTKNKRIKDLAKLTNTLTKEIVELGDEQDELRDVIVELQEEKHRMWERLAALEGKVSNPEQPERVRILKVKEDSEWEVGEIAKVVMRSGNILLLQKENYDSKDWFNVNEVTEQLHVDPVDNEVLEFGSHAVIVNLPYEGSEYTFKNDDIVRVGVKATNTGNYICDNQNGCAWVDPHNLKPQ